jgi:hypothetical protein
VKALALASPSVLKVTQHSEPKCVEFDTVFRMQARDLQSADEIRQFHQILGNGPGKVVGEMAMFRQLRMTSAQEAKNTLPPRLVFLSASSPSLSTP